MGIDYIVAKEDYDEYMQIIENQKEEIEYLNNIINEFDEWLFGEQMMIYRSSNNERFISYEETRYKWIELKGSVK